MKTEEISEDTGSRESALNEICQRKKILVYVFCGTVSAMKFPRGFLWNCNPEANGSALIVFSCGAEAQAQTPSSVS